MDDNRETAITRRFRHHPPTSREVIDAHERVRAYGLALALHLDDVLPDCPEKGRALDAVDDVVMYANAGIARTQLKESVDG